MEKTKTIINAEVEIGNCGDGHFRARVTFKDDKGVQIHQTISPCFDTQIECEKAADRFCKGMAPVIAAGIQAVNSPNFEPDPEIDPAQYLH